MKVQVIKHRVHGAFVPMESVKEKPPFTGIFSIRERKDYKAGRSVLIARLVDPEEPGEIDVIPELMDAKVIGLKGQELTVTGYERIHEQDFAQSWRVMLS